MLGAAERRQLLLEGGDLRPHQELAMIEDPRGRLVDRLAEPLSLRRHVDERYRTLFDAGVLVHRGHRPCKFKS